VYIFFYIYLTVLVTSSLKAVRAFEILGMLLVGGAVLLALLQLVVLKDKLVILKLAGLCAAVAGCTPSYCAHHDFSHDFLLIFLVVSRSK